MPWAPDRPAPTATQAGSDPSARYAKRPPYSLASRIAPAPSPRRSPHQPAPPTRRPRSAAARGSPPNSPRGSRRSAFRPRRRQAPAAPPHLGRPAATSTATGSRSPAAHRPGSAPRPPPPRSPPPSNAQSPHRVPRHRSATTPSTPTANPSRPAAPARPRPPAGLQRAPAVGKIRRARRTTAPTRPPPRRKSAHPLTTAGPCLPTASPDPNTRRRCPACTTRHGRPPRRLLIHRSPMPAGRPRPGHGRARRRWRKPCGGCGDG